MDSAEVIAEGLKDILNALSTTVAFNAVVPEGVPIVDRAVADATIQVYPYEETEEDFDRGDAFAATRTVQVIVQAPLTGSLTRKTCLAWLNELKEGFREETIAGTTDTWRFDRSETVSLYDFEAFKEKQQFLSLLKVRFYTFG